MINEDVCLTRLIGGSTILDRAEVAQSVEHLTENQGVTSSILVLGTSAAFEIWRLFFSSPPLQLTLLLPLKERMLEEPLFEFSGSARNKMRRENMETTFISGLHIYPHTLNPDYR